MATSLGPGSGWRPVRRARFARDEPARKRRAAARLGERRRPETCRHGTRRGTSALGRLVELPGAPATGGIRRYGTAVREILLKVRDVRRLQRPSRTAPHRRGTSSADATPGAPAQDGRASRSARRSSAARALSARAERSGSPRADPRSRPRRRQGETSEGDPVARSTDGDPRGAAAAVARGRPARDRDARGRPRQTTKGVSLVVSEAGGPYANR